LLQRNATAIQRRIIHGNLPVENVRRHSHMGAYIDCKPCGERGALPGGLPAAATFSPIVEPAFPIFKVQHWRGFSGISVPNAASNGVLRFGNFSKP
jgi:hypothetical protein